MDLPREGLLTSILILCRDTLGALEANLVTILYVTSILLICKLSQASPEASTRIQRQDLLSTIAPITRRPFVGQPESDLFDKESVWVASLYFPSRQPNKQGITSGTNVSHGKKEILFPCMRLTVTCYVISSF